MFARSVARIARPAAASIKARGFATASRATAAAGSRMAAFATAGAVAAGAASYAYFQNVQSPIHADAKPIAGVKGGANERTFIAVKPDGVQRGLVGKIINRFEERGYKLVGLKAVVPSKDLAEQHYADLKGRPFFGGLVDYMTNGKAPVIAMVWEGKDVIRQGRSMIGATNPLEAGPGSIRGQYCISVGRNIIHGSDSYESAEKEIGLWFGKAGELIEWEAANAQWIFSDN
ncbi:nucleoside diphosphate kinase [Radiomyces spectabilis]|uniref:nucleoside diphosphate kinase n=1 Tax=Radiomyces spectabilis TaxID=64574 RepID=UPI002220ECD0|nr:nucleoside diphosphate kinase [Radiomyces spectabilis]KAI8388431.1 nucleoside diphosphate kinase [Radiomyces spectabilis]